MSTVLITKNGHTFFEYTIERFAKSEKALTKDGYRKATALEAENYAKSKGLNKKEVIEPKPNKPKSNKQAKPIEEIPIAEPKEVGFPHDLDSIEPIK